MTFRSNLDSLTTEEAIALLRAERDAAAETACRLRACEAKLRDLADVLSATPMRLREEAWDASCAIVNAALAILEPE